MSFDGVDFINDSYLSFAELCVKYGFQFQTHTVITDDGYIL
jgi:hypothetical protein